MQKKDKDESTPKEPKTNSDDDMKKFRKMLRIRYCMNSVIGEVTRSVNPATNCLTEELFIRLDYMRDQVASALTIVKASYGHPNDLLRQYDVTEKIQGDYLHFTIKCVLNSLKTYTYENVPFNVALSNCKYI